MTTSMNSSIIPIKLKSLIEEKKLICLVAIAPERSSAGPRRASQMGRGPPVVYEPCLGIVDPKVKGRGLFSQLFEHAMKWVNSTPMQYCFFDFVTNHDFTQRFVAHYGTARPCPSHRMSIQGDAGQISKG